MDPQRFDRLSRKVAEGLSRRGFVGRLGRGGAVAAFGVAAIAPVRAAAQGEVRTCTYDFRAEVLVGPSSEEADFRTVEGELTLAIEADGGIDDGRLTLDGGDELDVVGQATGRAVSLRIALGGIGDLVAVGTAERDARACRGTMGGPATGPTAGDLGSWTATAREGAATAPAAGTGAAGAPAGPAGTGVTCEIACDDTTQGLISGTCECACAAGLAFCTNQGMGGLEGYCVDLQVDPYNCGACGNRCPTGPEVDSVVCADGACSARCNKGYGSCSGGAPCADLVLYDPANCGACGAACAENFVCDFALCVCSGSLTCGSGNGYDEACTTCVCNDGRTACGLTCVDVMSDILNCGACGNVCGADQAECVLGRCLGVLEEA